MLIKTESGFECEVKENAFDDYRVMKIISRIEDGSTQEQLSGIISLMERILGAEQEEALIIRLEELSEDGIATTGAMFEELKDIMGKVLASKKN